MIIANEENFSQISDGMVLFWGPWCRPCNDIIARLPSLVCVNVDENYNLVQEHKIVVVPTLLVFLRGEVLYRLVGSEQIDSYFTTV